MNDQLSQDELQSFWNEHLPAEADNFEAVWSFFLALLDENTKVNLFSRKLSPELVFQDQIVDCALGLPFFETSARVLDFGCGGGLPGAILASCRPMKEFILLDKSPKKIHHLKQICQKAGIENVRFSSESSPKLFEGVDTITSRAVAPASKLLRLIEPHLNSKDHIYLLFKARMENIHGELADLPKNFSSKVHPIAFPGGLRERHMVEIQPQ
jgi:16S rRNA (guanine(527)-N(7))-methyltransferase RsmG